MPVFDIEDLERESLIEKSRGVIEAEKQCKITLSKDAPRALELPWNAGGKHGRPTIIYVQPGESVIQPLAKSQVWLGPFTVPFDFKRTTDETRRNNLKAFWAQEKRRILWRYDYPRPISASKSGIEPTGPHRFPDVTVTILEPDGSAHEPIRLHEMYKIGEFDEAYPLDSFGDKETVDSVTARYEAQLDEAADKYAKTEAQIARLSGLLEGFMTGKAQAELAKPAAPKAADKPKEAVPA